MTQDNNVAKANENKQNEEGVIYGRSAFLVQTVDQGVGVLPVLIDKENKVRSLQGNPAIFPTLEYALSQIEELKVLVTKHFEDRNKVVEVKAVEVKEEVSPKKEYKLGEDAS